MRTYREKQLAPYGIEVIEPLWGRTSGQIMEEFLASGLETVIVTTTADVLGREFIGRRIDAKLVADLPEGVDPCGENGEYHTFCYGGGMFRTRVPFTLGAPMQQSYPVRLDDGTERFYTYWFADLTRESRNLQSIRHIRRTNRKNEGTARECQETTGKQSGKAREQSGAPRQNGKHRPGQILEIYKGRRVRHPLTRRGSLLSCART